MARVENPILSALRGKWSDFAVFKKRGDKYFMCKLPEHDGKLSPRQMTNAEIMADAGHYASLICDDPQAKAAAQVRLDKPSNKVYHALVSEYYKLHKEERMANPDVRTLDWKKSQFKTKNKGKRLTRAERDASWLRFLEHQKK